MTAIALSKFLAAEFNTYIRDDLLMTAPAKATVVGNTFDVASPNSIEEIHPSALATGIEKTTTLGHVASNPCCILKKTALFTIADNANVVVTGWAADRNDSVGGVAMFSSGANDQLVIRETATYDVGVQARWTSNATNTIRVLYVIANGTVPGSASGIISSVEVGLTAAAGLSFDNPILCEARFFIATGTVLRVIALQNSGAPLDLRGSAQLPMYFWARKVPDHGGDI
jgi:hypothetical protein